MVRIRGSQGPWCSFSSEGGGRTGGGAGLVCFPLIQSLDFCSPAASSCAWSAAFSCSSVFLFLCLFYFISSFPVFPYQLEFTFLHLPSIPLIFWLLLELRWWVQNLGLWTLITTCPFLVPEPRPSWLGEAPQAVLCKRAPLCFLWGIRWKKAKLHVKHHLALSSSGCSPLSVRGFTFVPFCSYKILISLSLSAL